MLLPLKYDGFFGELLPTRSGLLLICHFTQIYRTCLADANVGIDDVDGVAAGASTSCACVTSSVVAGADAIAKVLEALMLLCFRYYIQTY